jgi:putative hydrolase of the HAD superfamily
MGLQIKHSRIDWDKVDTVLLDMDGTLIDKHHDNFLWHDVVPNAYAKKHGIGVDEARAKLKVIYSTRFGTVDWGNIDYWEKRLGLRIWELKEKAAHFAKPHPHTKRFLRFLRKRGKKIYLITASLPNDVKWKLSHAKLSGCFDDIYTEIEIGGSKAKNAFWNRLEKKIGYDKERTLFADDDPHALRAAQKHGLKYILFKTKHSSKEPTKHASSFFAVHHFDDVLY